MADDGAGGQGAGGARVGRLPRAQAGEHTAESACQPACEGMHASPKRSFHDSVTPQMISDVGWAIAISSTTFTSRPKGGHGKGGVCARINDKATYRQPRRVTWSVPASADNDRLLYAYTQAKRPPEDWRCRLMPEPVHALINFLWLFAKSHGWLGPVS